MGTPSLKVDQNYLLYVDFYSPPLRRVTRRLYLLAFRAQRRVLVNFEGDGGFPIAYSSSEPRPRATWYWPNKMLVCKKKTTLFAKAHDQFNYMRMRNEDEVAKISTK